MNAKIGRSEFYTCDDETMFVFYFETWQDRVAITQVGDVYTQDGYSYEVVKVTPDAITLRQLFGNHEEFDITEEYMEKMGDQSMMYIEPSEDYATTYARYEAIYAKQEAEEA